MRTKPRNWWIRRSCPLGRHHGLSLVEAMVGMALLGTLLVALLVASSRLTAQRGRADRRLEGCSAADELLESWWTKPAKEFPRSGEGPVPGHEGWSWRMQTVKNDAATALEAEAVALEVFPPAPAPVSKSQSAAVASPEASSGTEPGDREPAARVEILLPQLPRNSQ